MDTEDEATAYLKLFSEGSHNYLLHSTEDGLNDAFPVEPIFTEIASDWPADGLPILLSGSFIADDNDSGSTDPTEHFLTETNTAQTEDNSVVKVFTDKSSLVLPNDVLLSVEETESRGDTTVTHVINGDTYSITYSQEAQDEAVETEDEEEVIQLLNIDGTVTNINKNLLNGLDGKGKDRGTNCDNFYTQVQAHKCKLCHFLCESVEEIVAHLKLSHEKEVLQNNGAVVDGNLVGTKMTSILNANQENQDKQLVLYLCSTCKNGYSDKEDLRQHMISQHKMVPIAPGSIKPKLSEISPKRLARRSNTSLVHKQKAMRQFKCSIKGCPVRFDTDEARKKHEDCHVDQNKKQFMCPVCKVKFSVWRICSMHMWKSHSVDLGLLSCPMCNKFKSYSAMRVVNHMAIHNEEKPFVCTTCGKNFKQLNQLRCHEITHRPPDEVPNCFTQKQCEFCDRLFANSKSLKKHIKFVHDKFKPFICNICGHQTARKEMLQCHYRQHTGDKPYQCSYCEYRTADRNCMRKHTMCHFGATKYSCPHCNYQAIQTTAYKNHLKKNHPGKEGTYACTTCRYTTVNTNAYLAHVRCHELEKNKTVEKRVNVEDSESKSSDETQNFLNTDHSEEAVDTGGITIPAEFDLQTSLI